MRRDRGEATMLSPELSRCTTTSVRHIYRTYVIYYYVSGRIPQFQGVSSPKVLCFVQSAQAMRVIARVRAALMTGLNN